MRRFRRNRALLGYFVFGEIDFLAETDVAVLRNEGTVGIGMVRMTILKKEEERWIRLQLVRIAEERSDELGSERGAILLVDQRIECGGDGFVKDDGKEIGVRVAETDLLVRGMGFDVVEQGWVALVGGEVPLLGPFEHFVVDALVVVEEELFKGEWGVRRKRFSRCEERVEDVVLKALFRRERGVEEAN